MTPHQKLKTIRLEKGWSMSRLSLVTGLSKCVISKYEAGKSDIHVKTLVKWCVGLGVKPGEVLW